MFVLSESYFMLWVIEEKKEFLAFESFLLKEILFFMKKLF